MLEPPSRSDHRRFLLVRHGPTEAAAGICVGQRDDPLSADGLAAVVRLARSWRGPPPAGIVSSDLARARISAEVLARKLGCAITLDARLRELDFGHWTGRTWEAIRAADPAHFAAWAADWVQVAPPAGESFQALRARVRQVWQELCVGADRRPWVLVAHAGSIRALLCDLLDLAPERAFSFAVDPARVYALCWSAGPAELCYGNCPSFLTED
jgi:broad specificity phosphatase PhoE